ncbi:histidine kinase [Streptomyces sp. NPDC006393]|uniref:sensor histidine kinase n=1 Tax=Streptomyces sp. NPDC006393 TaxID=3156763 RepID=UPI0033CDB305
MTTSARIGEVARDRWLPWIAERVRAAARCASVCLLAAPTLAAGLLAVLGLALARSGVSDSAVDAVILPARATARMRRGLVKEWTGEEVDSPYDPQRRPAEDPATRRDAVWLLLEPAVGPVLALSSLVPVGEGLYGLYLAITNGTMFRNGYIDWYPFVTVHKGHTGPLTLMALAAAALVLFGLWCALKVITWHGRWTAMLLAPTEAARLALLTGRVRHLTESRADAIDAQAAELSRIERDLHDGAQARLAAMGMTLGAAAQLLDKHPEEARAMLLEARDASARALAELRGLVRGIRPPVLADRGLADAVRALALDCALPVEVNAALPGRLDAPVESAAYFAAAEALANAAKHSGASRVWVEMRHENGRLCMSVQDDGSGGADPAKGGGLRGIERRLAAFDGVLAVSSPPGGPTLLGMEIPCG